MALNKYVDSQMVPVTAEEEVDIQAKWAEGADRGVIQATYNQWETSLPDQKATQRCIARVTGALASGGTPLAQDVSDLASYNLLIASEPPKPGAM